LLHHCKNAENGVEFSRTILTAYFPNA